MRASQRIELVFWDLVVDVLSESKTVRRSLTFIAPLFDAPEMLRVLRVAVFASVFGFFFGVAVTFFFDILLNIV